MGAVTLLLFSRHVAGVVERTRLGDDTNRGSSSGFSFLLSVGLRATPP